VGDRLPRVVPDQIQAISETASAPSADPAASAPAADPAAPSEPAAPSAPAASVPGSGEPEPELEAEPEAAGAGEAQRTTGRRKRDDERATAERSAGATTTPTTPRTGPQRSERLGERGLPTARNPATSIAIPGAAPLGVPNFFIDKFRIPPFLLSIYQAAGVEYGIRWEVLAAINEIETDYGRNLNVSSAGALGWMQFMPATWKAYGVDANGDRKKDPYNPVDAIFAAAGT
jgi:hypothetical protein